MRFAKTLGFFEDAPWSFENSLTPEGEQEIEESTRFSYLAHDQDDTVAPPQSPVDY